MVRFYYLHDRPVPLPPLCLCGRQPHAAWCPEAPPVSVTVEADKKAA